MYRTVFANRWIALLFVLLMAASAASLVGTEESDGVLDHATQQIAEQRADFEAEAAKLAAPSRTRQVIEQPDTDFLQDEELIDEATGLDTSGLDTTGFDPTPDAPEGFEPEPAIGTDPALAEEGEVVIVEP